MINKEASGFSYRINSIFTYGLVGERAVAKQREINTHSKCSIKSGADSQSISGLSAGREEYFLVHLSANSEL